MTAKLRPWRDHERSNTTTDRQVVSSLADDGPARPRDIARGRFRENVIRLQCRYLDRLGVLATVATDAYRLASAGRSVFDDRLAPGSSEYVDISPLVTGESRHVTDLSVVDSAGLKELNTTFLDDGAFRYGYVDGSREQTERRIHNVKDYRLDRFVREFPRTEPLCCQCAHWMRAVVGLHFFPDANHRTAMSSLYVVLDRNGLAPDGEWPFDWVDVAVTRSKLLRGYHCDVRFDTLWERDELYLHWLRYFRDNILDTARRPRNEISAEFLDRVLGHARDLRERL